MAAKYKGLSSIKAEQLYKTYGKNALPEKPPPSDIIVLLTQFKSPLVYILLTAGIVTLLLGELSDTLIIFFAVIVNSALGFFQERRANKSLTALKKLVHPKAWVIRDGNKTQISASNIVPGDYVVISYGEKIPADGELIEANRLAVAEALLTGESAPVSKETGDKVYMSTIVTTGQGVVRVEVTGGKTEVGKIAYKVQEKSEQTPFEKQLGKFSKQLTYVVVALTIFVFASGMVTGKKPIEMFKTSVALSVSAIPEGLLVALTVVLAVGMQRILRHRGLVRNLISAETLGGVTVICADKTGTLTKGKLTVSETIGNEQDIVRQAFVTNDDPVMAPTLEWLGNKFTSIEKKIKEIEKEHERLDYLPFSPKNRFFASLNLWDKSSNMVFVNGAPEVLLKASKLSDKEQRKLLSDIDKISGEGKRVIALARKKLSTDVENISIHNLRSGLDWVGLLIFTDPVRVGIPKVIKQAEKAGIRVMLITGDYAKTALSVMRDIGLPVSSDRVVIGDELEKMSLSKLSSLLQNKSHPLLFARTKPQQKLKIVEALKNNGEVVAMMGDGVNDAPALAKADIGIVVGEATDVAKESADLVLLDSKFETVIEAIREGRGIFDNIRKIILYLMSDAFEEIVAVVGTIILGLPLPITAAQILWINIISDGFPHLALTVDPKGAGIMQRPPRLPSERIVAPWMRMLIIIVSLVGGVVALTLFIFYLNKTNNLQLARSVAFATLGVNSLVYVFSVRTLTSPFWNKNPFNNKWLNVAVVVGLFFQFLPFIVPKLRDFFGLVSLSVLQWTVVFGASLVVFIVIELLKAIYNKKLQRVYG